MKTAISLPDSLFRAVERAAKRLGVSRSEVFQLAVREYLENHRHMGVAEALNQVYGRQQARVDPLIAHLQSTSLEEDEW